MSTAYKKCVRCHGNKRIIGTGMIEKDCPECDAIGWITYEQKAVDAKQDQVESPKDSHTKAAMDQSATDSCETKWGNIGEKSTVGIGAKDLRKRRKSGKDGKEV